VDEGLLDGQLGLHVPDQPVDQVRDRRRLADLDLHHDLRPDLSLLFAVPVAIWSAYRQGGKFDRVGTTTAFGLLSAPNYIVAPVLMAAFCVQRKWIPYPSVYAGSTTRSPTSRRSCCPSSPLPSRSTPGTCGCCAPT
jgi:hypothetical protein